MPLNHCRVLVTFLFLSTFSISLFAQTEVTSADVMRERISKAKAYLVVKNYNAAIYELENIKRESKDSTVNRVLNVLLMNSYLEQANYEKAQSFLKEFYKSNQTNITTDYFAIAGQVVKGAKNQLERYKALGLSVADRNLPLEASTDVENMRKTLELVVEQTRELSKKQDLASSALVLLEETSAIRAGLAKDDYDSKRWKDQISDAREQMMGSRSVIINAVKNPNAAGAVKTETISLDDLKEKTAETETNNSDQTAEFTDSKIQLIPVPSTSKSAAPDEPTVAEKPKKKVEAKKETSPETKPETVITKKDETVAKKESAVQEPSRPRITDKKTDDNSAAAKEREVIAKSENTTAENVAETKTTETNNADSNEPMSVGSLIGYAVRKVNPVYPRTARSMRMTGVVKVEVMIDEDGEVAAVENTNGPAMLRQAAEDAVKKWKFKPFVRDGQPVRATGYVSFNFSL